MGARGATEISEIAFSDETERSPPHTRTEYQQWIQKTPTPRIFATVKGDTPEMVV